MQPLLLALAVTAASGTPSAGSSVDEAKRSYREGKAAYDGGDYDLAIKDFLLAYQLSNRGELLFDIAIAYRDSHDLAKAKDYYQRYLIQVPNGKSHDLAVQQLAEVQQKLAVQEAAQPPPLAETTPSKSTTAPVQAVTAAPADMDHHPRPTAIVLESFGIAAGVLAVVGVVEATSFKGWQSYPPGTVLQISDVQSRVNTANSWATIALVSGIAAVGAVGAGLLTW